MEVFVKILLVFDAVRPFIWPFVDLYRDARLRPTTISFGVLVERFSLLRAIGMRSSLSISSRSSFLDGSIQWIG